MYLLSHNIAAVSVAVLLSALAWVWGGARGDLLPSFVPWLSFLVFEMMLFFPEQLDGESLAMARSRVWSAMKKDACVWLSLGLIVYLAIPFLNERLSPTLEPPIAFLPFCIRRAHHLSVFLWFVPTLLAAIAARHSLCRHGKRLLLELLVWNGVALSVFGFLQLLTGAENPFWTDHHGPLRDFFSTFGYPNMGGDYFTALTMLAIGLWRFRENEHLDEDLRRRKPAKILWLRHYPAIAVVFLYLGALSTLSRSAILLSTVGVVFLLVLAGMEKLKRLDKARRIRYSGFVFLGAVIITAFALLFTPEKLRQEIDSIDSVEALDRITGRSELHSKAAMDVLWDFPLFGCGGWGYPYYCPEKFLKYEAKPRKYWGPGSANVHNDYLQFLAEHGIVGFMLMFAVFAFLLQPTIVTWVRLAKEVKFVKHAGLPWPREFFVFPPAGIAVLVAALTTLIHAFGDCPLRSAAVLALLYTEIACLEGFLPRPKKA